MAKAMPALAAVAARVALARLRLLAAAAAARLRTLAPRDARADAAADKNKMCEGSVHKGARGLPFDMGKRPPSAARGRLPAAAGAAMENHGNTGRCQLTASC